MKTMPSFAEKPFNATRGLIPLLVFWAILCVGLVLRLTGHFSGRLSLDELVTRQFAMRDSLTALWTAGLSEPTPPVFDTFAHLAWLLFGDSPESLRIPSLLFGMLILPIVFWTVRWGGFKRSDSLGAMAVAAVSSVLIYYSQEVRPYSMLALTGVMSVGLLLRCLQKTTRLNLALFTISVIIVPHTHRYGLLLLPAEFICIVLYRQWKLLKWFIAGSMVVGLLLVLHIAAGNFTFAESWERTTSWASPLYLINMLNVGTIKLPFLQVHQPSPLVAYPASWANLAISLSGLTVFSLAFYTGLANIKTYSAQQKQTIIVLLLCVGVPAVLALLAGSPMSPKPQWLLRGLIFTCPLYSAAAVALVSSSRFKLWFIMGMIIINLFSTNAYYRHFSRFSFIGAFEYLNKKTSENDIILASPWYLYEAINYYYRGPAQKAAYVPKVGWIDLRKLRESNNPFYTSSLPLAIETPVVKGTAYFFWTIQCRDSLAPFAGNAIFVFDTQSESFWKRIDRETGWPPGRLKPCSD